MLFNRTIIACILRASYNVKLMNGLPNNETRSEFLVDTMVRGLVRWLRLLGYKAWDAGTLNDAKTIIQKNPKIILLTCSKSHLEQIQPARYLLLLEDHLENQLHRINYKFGIFRDIHLLSICSFCNIEVKSVDKSEIEKNIPERVAENYEIFRQCPECKRVYWQGGHIIRLKDKLRRMNIPISDFDSPNSKP